MIEINIPGYGQLQLEHLVLDYNGTLANDGVLRDGVIAAMQELANTLSVHVLTGDTFGLARSALTALPCMLSILSAERQDLAKKQYVEELGAHRTICIGNGRNDRLMLQVAALSIAVMQEEGAAIEALQAADIVCPSIESALGLLRNPLRMVATLRS